MNNNARLTALKALIQVEKNEGYSNIVLDRALRSSGLEGRDSALCSTLFYGVLEKRITLDYDLRQCLNAPNRKLDPVVFEALRLGAYQILYLDRVPDSAAVNETVNALKEMGRTSFSGLVNGVLRSLSRKKDGLSFPQGDTVKAWSLRYSVPEPLILLWINAYGPQITKDLLISLEEKPGIYIRVNTLKTTPESLKASMEAGGIAMELLPRIDGAGRLEGCGSPTALPQFQEGMFHIQDLSAQWVCELLDPQPGDTICDCCAAPGGKAFTLAQKAGESGKVLALDLYKKRVGLIRQGAERLGLPNIEAGIHDASVSFEGFPLFDKVLCDVPCSGFGVIRRKPEIRYKNLSSCGELPELQLKILKNASALVKPGGMLIYATCTLIPAENLQVARRFLDETPEFEPVKINLPGIQRVLNEPDHVLTMLPFSGASDGFFAAAFRRRQELGESPWKR